LRAVAFLPAVLDFMATPPLLATFGCVRLPCCPPTLHVETVELSNFEPPVPLSFAAAGPANDRTGSAEIDAGSA
jgi:hypothetical protein